MTEEEENKYLKELVESLESQIENLQIEIDLMWESRKQDREIFAKDLLNYIGDPHKDWEGNLRLVIRKLKEEVKSNEKELKK